MWRVSMPMYAYRSAIVPLWPNESAPSGHDRRPERAAQEGQRVRRAVHDRDDRRPAVGWREEDGEVPGVVGAAGPDRAEARAVQLRGEPVGGR